MKARIFPSGVSALLLVVPSVTACYTTTLRSGLPAAPPTVEYDAKWHGGLILGIAELSGPYDLQKVCPGGWAEIKTETSFVNGVVDAVTWGIYSPQSVTIRCASGSGSPTNSSLTSSPEARSPASVASDVPR